MQTKIVRSLVFMCLLMLLSCSAPPSEKDETADKSPQNEIIAAEKPLIKIVTMKRQNFNKEIISNGKLISLRKTDLFFRTSENIKKIYVKNSDKIKQGQVIAELEPFTIQNRLSDARLRYTKAQLDLEDFLIGQGYSVVDSLKIPPEVWKTAGIKSGYSSAQIDLKQSEYEFNCTKLIAPFDGVVANLSTKEFNRSTTNERFCTVMDNNTFEAVFAALETELSDIFIGQTVSVIPFYSDSLIFHGIISEINPTIDLNGLIEIKAIVQNRNNKLVDGMNIKVKIETVIPSQLIVPKEAVVLRSNRPVVFTYQNGLAKWNYVTTGFENSTSFSITEGLNAGDTVIIEGNLNLGHDAEVKLIKE